MLTSHGPLCGDTDGGRRVGDGRSAAPGAIPPVMAAR